jgi:lipopolysaccharide transport system ATP-binding protein
MSSDDLVIDASGLSKRYEIYATPRDRLKQILVPPLLNGARHLPGLRAWLPPAAPAYFREFWALRDVSFQVRQGETLGIVGRNGAGKSTLLQILAGTLAPTAGAVRVQGRVAALLELGSGFNPEFTGRENVVLNGSILGLSRKQVEAKYDKIVAFADIGDFIEQPVKTYSSGMFLRLAFAVQAHIDASVVIIDEALAVGDVFFRQKCYARLEELRRDGAAVLLVSHSMPEIEQFCERAIVLHRGTVHFEGSGPEAAKHYYLLHQPVRGGAPAPAPAASGAPATRPAETQGFARPPREAFFDLSAKVQVSAGAARCTGVALCDVSGAMCRSFRQGDTAVFYYEFEIAEAMEVPICGMTISNERGVIVFGKNAWQYEGDAPRGLHPGDKVCCRQEVALELAPGDYTFEIGLVSSTQADWERRARMAFQETLGAHVRECHIALAGSFSIGLALHDGIPTLTHHGVANLPGRMSVEKVAARKLAGEHA